jgi:uracil-DNA glycosylase
MLEYVNTDWKPILQHALSKCNDIEEKVSDERNRFTDLLEIYPPPSEVFAAFNYFNFNKLKIVIIGQDPYHQPKQANGLAFSVKDGIKIPPSLQNIFKEIHNNFDKKYIKPESGNLEYLAKQGVLLINNTLTVRQGKPNSHLKIWKGFSTIIIREIMKRQKNVIFMVWGNNAKKIIDNKLMLEFIDDHIFYRSSHPSPLSANKGGWFYKGYFSKVNKRLIELGKEPIQWI